MEKRWRGRSMCHNAHTRATVHIQCTCICTRYLSLCHIFCIGIKSEGVNPLVLVLPSDLGCESSSHGSATSIPYLAQLRHSSTHGYTQAKEAKGLDEIKLYNKWRAIGASFMNGHPKQVHVVNPNSPVILTQLFYILLAKIH